MAHPWRRRSAWTLSTIVLVLGLTVGSAAAERVSGTSNGETIRGTNRADTLLGRAGDDRIFGLAGADVVTGGRGRDRLWGGPGLDRLLARDGAVDLVVCGPGRDTAIVDSVDLVHVSCEAVRRPTPTTVEPSPPPNPAPVVAENAKPGTPGWAAFQLAPARAIEGYTDPSATPGDTLGFHVSTSSDERYRIFVYRAGYYGGVGARRVACLPSCDGAAEGHERAIPPASPEGLVHAGWPVSQRLEIPADWVSGYYFAHFQLASGPYAGRVTTTWFLLREAPGLRRAPILVQGSVSYTHLTLPTILRV